MRLFVAIRLDEKMKAALTETQSRLRRRGMRGNYTPAENLHLTLAFIGEYPDPEAAAEVLEALPFTPFSLRLEGFGHFGDLWWAGLARSGELTSCVRRLRHGLAVAGIPFDRKSFTPHITLVRRAVWDERAGLPAAWTPPGEMEVSHISLMRSDRGKNGMIYTELGRFPS